MGKARPEDYEFIVWRLAKTFNKFGYEIPSALGFDYSRFAYKYGYRPKWVKI